MAFGYPDVDEWQAAALGRKPGHIYSRNTNPTVLAFEEKVRLLEGAEAATSFATGMAAISNTLFTLLSPGDRLVSVKDTYGGTNKLFLDFLPRFQSRSRCATRPTTRRSRRQLRKGCRVLYLETPTNPTLKVVDIARLAAAGHKAGAIVVADNTFATPINQTPLALGVDLVLHSATKFLGGHADALGGVVCGPKRPGRADFIIPGDHRRGARSDGGLPVLRGMKTLHLRIRQQNESALQIARFLEAQPQVSRVFYPGLDPTPITTWPGGRCAVLAACSASCSKAASTPCARSCRACAYAHLAANLGAVETIAGPPATTSHVECTAEERKAMGIPEGLIRYSVGIEDTEDLIADLEQALQAG